MRIPPNPHPIVRFIDTLLPALSLISLWLLLGLVSCSAPRTISDADMPAAPDRCPASTRETVTRFAPMGPIPLAKPFERKQAALASRT